ncbi:MAG: thioesterase family protein [Acidimicrobiia bacterium]|nr:thioesterase family protein [Acidimicrobiia bacterium]MDH5236442.1 thioesterase family protein [Acidimicrobiia bacterium]
MSQTRDFDHDVAVTKLGPGRYRAEMFEHWWVVAGPNGGIVAAVLANAMTHELDDPARQLRTITVHYPAAAEAGPVELQVAVERMGRSVATLGARLIQDGRLIALATAAFSPAWTSPVTFSDLVPPQAPPASTLVDRREHQQDFIPPVAFNWDTRWTDQNAAFGGGGPAVLRAWIRTAEPRVVDPLALTAICDALPPAVFVRSRERMAAPTVELTVHIRAQLPHPSLAPDDHVLAECNTATVAEGFLDEDVRVWAADGTLLAHSRQLALAR